MSKHMIAAAKLFAAADKSDPFTFNRAMTHIKNGLADAEHRYSAVAVQEERTLPDGSKFSVTTYKSMGRP